MDELVGVCKECNGTGRIENNQGRYIAPDQNLFLTRDFMLVGYECLACKPLAKNDGEK